MPWKKANVGLIDLLQKAAANYSCDRRMMFGSPTFFKNNNMFAGVHEDTVILRLADEDRQAAMERGINLFEPMEGRPMKEYIALPESLAKNQEILEEWLDRSYRYASSLPAKPKKSGRR